MRPAGLLLWQRQDQATIEPGTPLVVFGGVGVFMNPEPLAPFADIMVIGEAEPILPALIADNRRSVPEPMVPRHDLLWQGRLRCLAVMFRPSMHFSSMKTAGFCLLNLQAGVPERVRKVVAADMDTAAHSQLLSAGS